MKQKTILIFAIIISVFLLGWLLIEIEGKTSSAYVKINEKRIKVEKAVTLEERTRGLSGRRFLCEECGMLFIFESPGHYPFHMREMRFGLDIIWIKGGRIVGISKEVPPNYQGNVSSQGDVEAVLEVNAGLSQKWGWQEGDSIFVE